MRKYQEYIWSLAATKRISVRPPLCGRQTAFICEKTCSFEQIKSEAESRANATFLQQVSRLGEYV